MREEIEKTIKNNFQHQLTKVKKYDIKMSNKKDRKAVKAIRK